MGDTYLVRKAFREYHRCAIRGRYRRVASHYYCGQGRGSYDFTGDPEAAIHYADFKTANAERLKLEKVLQEALDLARLSDALKLFDEGDAIKVTAAPVTPLVEEKPTKPVEPVIEGDLSEVDPAEIEV